MDKIETRTRTAIVESSTSIGFLLNRQKMREVTDIYINSGGVFCMYYCMWVLHVGVLHVGVGV